MCHMRLLVCVCLRIGIDLPELEQARFEQHAWQCAVAEAFSVACAKGDDVKVEDFDEVFKSEDAFAFAQVRVLT